MKREFSITGKSVVAIIALTLLFNYFVPVIPVRAKTFDEGITINIYMAAEAESNLANEPGNGGEIELTVCFAAQVLSREF